MPVPLLAAMVPVWKVMPVPAPLVWPVIETAGASLACVMPPE